MSLNKEIYISSEEELNKTKEQRELTFNGMSANEWATSSRSVWDDLPFPRSESKITDEDIIQEDVYSRILLMYSHEDDLVIDPFMGRGTSIISCIHNNRHGIGLEKDLEHFKKADENIVNSLNLLVTCDYYISNSTLEEYQSKIEDESLQLAMTSLVEYTETLSENYDSFLELMNKTFALLYPKMKDNGYVVLIVRDYRDIKNDMPYVEVHNDVARLALKNGFKYQDVIIYNHNGQRGLLLQGYPKTFYVNLNHSYVVVLRKIK